MFGLLLVLLSTVLVADSRPPIPTGVPVPTNTPDPTATTHQPKPTEPSPAPTTKSPDPKPCEDSNSVACKAGQCRFPYDQFCPKTCGLCD
ncbi:hypothetical protein ACHWQZ_G004462 [Mnemiopsis leidyi]